MFFANKKLFVNFCFRSSLKHVVSLNNASIRPNCPQMTEKEQWPPSNSPNLNTIEISCLAILKPSPEAQNSFCITVLQGALGKIKKSTILHRST